MHIMLSLVCDRGELRWGKAHPFGGKYVLAYLVYSKKETVNAVT